MGLCPNQRVLFIGSSTTSGDLQCYKRMHARTHARTHRRRHRARREFRKNNRVLLHIVKTEYPDQTPNHTRPTQKPWLNSLYSPTSAAIQGCPSLCRGLHPQSERSSPSSKKERSCSRNCSADPGAAGARLARVRSFAAWKLSPRGDRHLVF